MKWEACEMENWLDDVSFWVIMSAPLALLPPYIYLDSRILTPGNPCWSVCLNVPRRTQVGKFKN